MCTIMFIEFWHSSLSNNQGIDEQQRVKNECVSKRKLSNHCMKISWCWDFSSHHILILTFCNFCYFPRSKPKQSFILFSHSPMSFSFYVVCIKESSLQLIQKQTRKVIKKSFILFLCGTTNDALFFSSSSLSVLQCNKTVELSCHWAKHNLIPH